LISRAGAARTDGKGANASPTLVKADVQSPSGGSPGCRPGLASITLLMLYRLNTPTTYGIAKCIASDVEFRKQFADALVVGVVIRLSVEPCEVRRSK
jgi:hypothetical protein